MNNKTMGKVVICLSLIMQLCGCFCVSCDEKKSIETLNDENNSVGVTTGTIQEQIAIDVLPNAKLVYYSSFSDMALALAEHKITCFIAPNMTYEMLLELYPDFDNTGDHLLGGNIAFGFNKSESHDKLFNELNVFLIEHKEELDKIGENWMNGLGDIDMPNYKECQNINGNISGVVNATLEPFNYIENGEITGFEIDIIARFANEYGYSVELYDTNFDSVLVGLTQDRYDIGIATIAVTEERKQSIRFSEPYYSSFNVIVYNSSDKQTKNSNTIVDSFKKTFIYEDRYKLFLNGLSITLQITILSAFFGTILASLICYLKINGSKYVKKVCNIFIQVFEGTPILVILLIFYYIVFTSSNTNPMLVAVVVFSLNSAAFFAESFYAGIMTVDIGQKEAGLAMGYNEFQTFIKFILPIAASAFLPTYQSAIITLLKGTSIVSYVTIQDLTKVGEIVRSRTYEPLIPLISIAIIYFALSRIIIFVINIIAGKIKPQRIGKYLKGVDINDKD